MGVEGKWETDVKVKSSADNLFKLLTEEVHNVPDASSKFTRVTGRPWGPSISDGRKEEFKEKVEIDKEKKIMTLVAVGGDILGQYRAYKIVYHVTPGGDSVRVNLQIVYEKFDKNQDDPDNYLWFLINVLKDAHLVRKQG